MVTRRPANQRSEECSVTIACLKVSVCIVFVSEVLARCAGSAGRGGAGLRWVAGVCCRCRRHLHAAPRLTTTTTTTTTIPTTTPFLAGRPALLWSALAPTTTTATIGDLTTTSPPPHLNPPSRPPTSTSRNSRFPLHLNFPLAPTHFLPSALRRGPCHRLERCEE
ncbi:hypothetical protein E2C01_042450 [Portunus trituberculatus]|uniref:Uncharacterized protein n=1 Tax=Portunus trituberculatus TaxID=210409 RepID=A0A5B7FUU4_PORTR|nr:hypothetical protein [Portunus trituberculatus]